MEELLKALEELYDRKDNFYINEDDGLTYFVADDLYDRVTNLCCEHLITAGGRCNWKNIDILRNNKYRVFAAEEDGFGWLIGCVKKIHDNRAVYYG